MRTRRALTTKDCDNNMYYLIRVEGTVLVSAESGEEAEEIVRGRTPGSIPNGCGVVSVWEQTEVPDVDLPNGINPRNELPHHGFRYPVSKYDERDD